MDTASDEFVEAHEGVWGEARWVGVVLEVEKCSAHPSRTFCRALCLRTAYVWVITAAGGMFVPGQGGVLRTRGKRESPLPRGIVRHARALIGRCILSGGEGVGVPRSSGR